MAQLTVYKRSNGSPVIECPRCAELVVPEKNSLFDGHDCPECNGQIDSSTLRSYLKHLSLWEDGDHEA